MPRFNIEKITLNAVALGSNQTGSVVDMKTIDSFNYAVVVTAAAGLNTNLRLFGSNDGTNFAQIGSDVNVTANGTYLIPSPATAQGMHGYHYSRLDNVATAGTATGTAVYHGKGSA